MNYEEARVLYQQVHNGEKKVDLVKRQVMEHLESVEEARYFVDQMNKAAKKDSEEDAAIRMDPMGQQIEEDDEDDGIEEHEDYQHCNPDNIAENVEKEKNSTMFRRVEMPFTDELRRKTEGLDQYQNTVETPAQKHSSENRINKTQETGYFSLNLWIIYS